MKKEITINKAEIRIASILWIVLDVIIDVMDTFLGNKKFQNWCKKKIENRLRPVSIKEIWMVLKTSYPPKIQAQLVLRFHCTEFIRNSIFLLIYIQF